MTGDHALDFYQNREGTLLLPKQCRISVACYDSKEVQQAIVLSIYESLHALALSGMDLRALDGVTVALDARKAACEVQSLPEGAVPLEMSDQAETMELARTVAVRRDEEFRFHIVIRAGLGLMTHSSKADEQALACSCIAHEAAHVEHEGHLYRTFLMFMVVRWTVGIGPDKPSSRRLMSGVNMQPVDPRRSTVRKRWQISKGHSASPSMEAAQHPESGLKVSGTAVKRQKRSEKSNESSVTCSSVWRARFLCYRMS